MIKSYKRQVFGFREGDWVYHLGLNGVARPCRIKSIDMRSGLAVCEGHAKEQFTVKVWRLFASQELQNFKARPPTAEIQL